MRRQAENNQLQEEYEIQSVPVSTFGKRHPEDGHNPYGQHQRRWKGRR